MNILWHQLPDKFCLFLSFIIKFFKLHNHGFLVKLEGKQCIRIQNWTISQWLGTHKNQKTRQYETKQHESKLYETKQNRTIEDNKRQYMTSRDNLRIQFPIFQYFIPTKLKGFGLEAKELIKSPVPKNFCEVSLLRLTFS